MCPVPEILLNANVFISQNSKITLKWWVLLLFPSYREKNKWKIAIILILFVGLRYSVDTEAAVENKSLWMQGNS